MTRHIRNLQCKQNQGHCGMRLWISAYGSSFKMAGVTWTDEEIIKLIQIWGEVEIQAQLEGCTRNMHVYEKIARELRDMGYDRMAIQCREN